MRQAFLPTTEQVAWARALLEAAEASGGVFRFEGRMVDAPVITHAQTILAAAEQGTADQ